MYQAICYSFTAIKVESTKIDLAVNERKTKYMLSTSKDVWPTDPHITADNYNFDIVNEFILAPSLPPKNVSLEIKRRITLASKCYYSSIGN